MKQTKKEPYTSSLWFSLYSRSAARKIDLGTLLDPWLGSGSSFAWELKRYELALKFAKQGLFYEPC